MVMCDSCPFNTGVVYCSIPVQYQCRLTGEFHRSGEECDADVVAVVRCKDCKWYKESKHSELNSLRFCYRLRNDSGIPVGYNWDDNDFCSHGERREDEQT